MAAFDALCLCLSVSLSINQSINLMLSYLILSYRVLFCLILSDLILSYLTVSDLILPCLILSDLISRPDMTFAVDWALSNNYLSIYLILSYLI